MKERTKNFALRVIRLPRAISPSQAGKIIGRQLLSSATSVGANYRAYVVLDPARILFPSLAWCLKRRTRVCFG